jgi:broad specificity phosphatase PhoE
MGAIAGVPDEQIRTLHPDVFEQLRRFESGTLHPNDLAIPGKEEFADFAARAAEVVADLATKRRPVVVVAHHSVLTMLVHTLSAPGGNVDLHPYYKHSFPHLSVTIVERASDRQPADSGWSVRGIALTLQQAINLLDASA